MVSVLRLRGPRKMVISANNRVPGGLTLHLSTRGIGVLNASTGDVSGTRSHRGFSTVLSYVNMSRPH